jgi:hypothetical protein
VVSVLRWESEKPVPNGAKARQDLDLEKQSVVALGTGADSVQMKRISASTIGDTLAQKDCLVPGAFKMLR